MPAGFRVLEQRLVRRLAILCNESLGRIDAIRDHSFLLAEAVRQQGWAVEVCLKRSDAEWSVVNRGEHGESLGGHFDPGEYDAVVVQYNPFLFGKWGFAPWLPMKLWSWKRKSRVRIALMVHEPYVPMLDWKWVLMGTWQRMQLEATRVAADIVFASIEATTDALLSRRPSRPTHHLPVGSMLPDRRDARVDSRDHLKIGRESFVLASLGTDHPSRLIEYIADAVNAVANSVDELVLLNLGANAPGPEGLHAGVRVHRPGFLSDADLSGWLSAADLFLAPFADGVSTRRSSLMAALQHGLPVVGTDGHLTDGVLRRSSALLLAPVDRPDLFAQAAVELAKSPEERLASGRAARALYEATFDWPVLARRLIDALTDSTRNA